VKKLTIACGLALFIAALWALNVANKEAQSREQWAEGSSVDTVNFTAAGLLGQTLVISETAPITCTIYLDSLSDDSVLNAKVRRAGFTKASCGQETKSLR
jgi:hypothetical protein